MMFRGGGSRPAAMDLSLRLKLPEPDARSIEELVGEAIVVSTGRWREMSLTNLTATATNDIDLAAILPGARFTLTKLTQRNRQTTLQMRLTGPPSIREIDIELTSRDGSRGGASGSDRNFTAKGPDSTRSIQIDRYTYDGTDDKGPITLRVRFPEDRKKERLQFTLR